MSIPIVPDTTCATRVSTPSPAAFSRTGPSSIAPPAPAAVVRNSRRERPEPVFFIMPILPNHAGNAADPLGLNFLPQIACLPAWPAALGLDPQNGVRLWE